MRNKVLIWAEKVYENNFQCDYCSTKIADISEESEDIYGKYLRIDDKVALICPVCERIVAFEADEDFGFEETDKPKLVGKLAKTPSNLKQYLRKYLLHFLDESN